MLIWGAIKGNFSRVQKIEKKIKEQLQPKKWRRLKKSHHEKELEPLNLEELKEAGIEKVRLRRHFGRRFLYLETKVEGRHLRRFACRFESSAPFIQSSSSPLEPLKQRLNVATPTASIAIFDYCNQRKHCALAAHRTRHALAAHITSEIS